jgi:hypothetical protein
MRAQEKPRTRETLDAHDAPRHGWDIPDVVHVCPEAQVGELRDCDPPDPSAHHEWTNRRGGESSQAGSIPVRLRVERSGIDRGA